MAGNRVAGTVTRDNVEPVAAGGTEGETASAEIYRLLKIAAIYAKVSTERQEEEQTVDSQLDALYRTAREGGYEMVPSHVFVDERRSNSRRDCRTPGTSPWKRRIMARLTRF